MIIIVIIIIMHTIIEYNFLCLWRDLQSLPIIAMTLTFHQISDTPRCVTKLSTL